VACAFFRRLIGFDREVRLSFKLQNRLSMHILMSIIAVSSCFSFSCRVFYMDKAEGSSSSRAFGRLGRRIFNVRHLFLSQPDKDWTPIQKEYLIRSNFWLKVFYVSFLTMVIVILAILAGKNTLSSRF